MRWRRGRIIAAVTPALVVAAVTAALVLVAAESPAAAVAVDPDPAKAGYLASGSLLLDGTYTGSAADRAGAAACPGCRWRLATVCGPADLAQGESCPAAFAGCPRGAYRMRLARWSPAEPWWQWAGEVCLGAGLGPLPVDVVATTLRREVERLVPAPAPRLQPADVTLTDLPTVLLTGQPHVLGPLSLDVLGHPVRLTATATWRWQPGDGSSLTTTDPGRPWPTAAPAHRFRRPGAVVVVLTTTWTAIFTVDGLGPYDVAGPAVTQQAQRALLVRDARAHLVR